MEAMSKQEEQIFRASRGAREKKIFFSLDVLFLIIVGCRAATPVASAVATRRPVV